MRIYIIGNDGITPCREPAATVNKGDVAVASREELHAARLSAPTGAVERAPGCREADEGR